MNRSPIPLHICQLYNRPVDLEQGQMSGTTMTDWPVGISIVQLPEAVARSG